MKEYKVSIFSLCYNHAPYLKRTLDGISSQVTDFKFLTVIIDDASTDGTREVINEYLEEHFEVDNNNANDETDDAFVLLRHHKKNVNFYLAVVYLKYNFFQIKKSKATLVSEWMDKADYWAVCECDDYWIYDNKLQEEVEFLDHNPDYGLVYTDYDIHQYDTGEYIHAAFKNGIKPIITSFEQHLVNAAYIAPMSWVCRIPYDELRNSYHGPESIDMSFILALEAFLHSKVYYMDKVTCVYGKHKGSATKQTSIVKQYSYAYGVYSTQKYYLDKYNLRDKYPTCLDYFLNAYYCYIIANEKEKDYSEILAFFKRKGESSIKYRLFGIMMRSRLAMPLLKSICRYRIKSQ